MIGTAEMQRMHEELKEKEIEKVLKDAGFVEESIEHFKDTNQLAAMLEKVKKEKAIIRGPNEFNCTQQDPDRVREASKKADERQVGGDHYKKMAVQPWDVMEAVLTPEEFRGFLKGNIIKYSMRQGKKDGADEDEGKALHYMQKLEEIENRWF